MNDDDEITTTIDRIYDDIDDLLCAGRFDDVDTALRAVDVDTLPTEVLVAWLIITLAARSRLRERAPFVERVRARLADDPERDAILRGLA